MSSTRFYRPELDALRFMAFCLVFFYHTAFSIRGEMSAQGGSAALIARFTPAGSYGVDVFFLLSSYLITELFIREKTRLGSVNILAFYKRRILRIWPLYFFFLIFTLVGSRISPMQFPNGAILPFFFFYGNFWLMTHSFFSPGGVLWSVSIEEQFYLVCPIVVRNVSPLGMMAVACLLILLANLARFILLDSSAFMPQALWVCTITRLDPIATGMLACLLLRGRALTIAWPIRIALLLGGLLALYGAAVWLHGNDANLSLADGMMAYPLADLGALAIFLCFLGAKKNWRPFVYLGKISYGLYVYHIFALDIAKVGLLHFTGNCTFWLRAMIAFPLTVLLAAISYKFLEAPFLKLKSKTLMLSLSNRMFSVAPRNQKEI